MTIRSESVAKLVHLARAVPDNLGDALAQVSLLAVYWPTLRPDEKRKIKAAALGYTGLIEQRTCRATGFLMSLYDSVKQGIEHEDTDPENRHESGDYHRGRWMLKYAVVCEEHDTVVCVGSKAQGHAVMATADFCEKCQSIIEEKQE